MIKKIFKTQDHKYPLMRDLQRNPRCYELTDKEREEAIRQVDRILRERAIKNEQGYYGA